MQQDSEINVQRMFHMVGRAHKVIFMNPGNSKSLKKKGDRDDSEKPKRKFVKWQKGQKAAAGEGAISRHAGVGVLFRPCHFFKGCGLPYMVKTFVYF